MDDTNKQPDVPAAGSDAISLASHQLKSSLGLIKWSLEALEDDDYFKKAPPEFRKSIDDIYQSNEKILALVRDLVSAARGEPKI